MWDLNEILGYVNQTKWPRGPEAPTSLTATAGDVQLLLSWTAPATTHGTITDYEVEYTAPYIDAGDQYWANVELLLPLDGSNAATTFTDASTNAISVTRSNQTVISTAQSKFGGASAFFDGTGDRLNISNAAIAPGAGDFCVEFWLRASAVNANKVLYAFAADADPGIWLRSNGTIAFYHDSGVYAASAAISANTWYHIAVSRASGVVRVFVDGVPSSTTYTFTDSITSTSASIGGVANFDAGTLSGYIDDFRLTVGSARGYTAAFTPPSSAHPANGNAGQAAVNQTVRTGSTSASYTLTGLTNDTEYTFRVAAINHTQGEWSDSVAVTPGVGDPDFASVTLLLHADGSNGSTTFTDSSGSPKSVSAVNATISTAQSKFGGSSGRLNGSSYLSLTHGTNFGTGDLTIETWAFGTYSGDSILCEFRSAVTLVAWATGTSLYVFTPAGNAVRGTLTANQWQHIAVCRQAGLFRVYVDGTQTATWSDGSSLNTAGNLYIGRFFDNAVSQDWYFDDYRISTVCRYPDGTAFTPPTAAFPTL
jgi:hypothetical protein